MKKFTIYLLCLMMLFSCTVMPASASDGEITPRYNNVITTYTDFSISDSGIATVTIGYKGISGTTTGATITTKIQKRSLGFIWTKIDIGTINNEWVDTATGAFYSNSHSVTLPNTGTYRVVVNYEISGTGGATDEIEDTYTAEY